MRVDMRQSDTERELTYFSKARCATCFAIGLVGAVVTVLVLASMVVYLVMSNCHGQSGCAIVYAFAPMVVMWILVSIGIVEMLLRVTLFRSNGKMVPSDYIDKLRIGQKLMLVPLVGAILSIPIGLGVNILM